ncbi:hypothetical protein TNCV_2226351 [Trichonephila clavipes]|nr:hypothetical protein TNCV_2226351 [Trichonephila clavipes]
MCRSELLADPHDFQHVATKESRVQTVLCPERTNDNWDQVLVWCGQIRVHFQSQIKRAVKESRPKDLKREIGKKPGDNEIHVYGLKAISALLF